LRELGKSQPSALVAVYYCIVIPKQLIIGAVRLLYIQQTKVNTARRMLKLQYQWFVKIQATGALEGTTEIYILMYLICFLITLVLGLFKSIQIIDGFV